MDWPRWFRKSKSSQGPTDDTNDRKNAEANAASDDAFGLTLLSDQTPATGSQYSIDVIAVHGLGGGAHRTWTHENGTLWLRDLLPDDLPGARIFAYGYNSATVFSQDNSTLRDFARGLLLALRRVRVGMEERARPLVFVCHSMGGIVVKQALILARNEVSQYPGFNDSVSGIMFLATPHRGSCTASYGAILSRIVNSLVIGSQMSRFTGSVRTDLLARLQESSEELLRLTEDFRVHADTIHIGSFIEKRNAQGFNNRIVDDQSAVIGVPNERLVPMEDQDHQSICKFAKRDNNYGNLLSGIKDCERKLQKDWEGNQDSKEFHVQFQLDKIPITKHFVLRAAEMKAVGKSLLPSNQRSGRKVHVLCGLGGAGKTQLAVAFARSHQNTFTAILWLDGESRGSLLQSLATFGQRAKIIPPPDLAAGNGSESHLQEMNARRVIDWLNSERNDKWLMIFDNVEREYDSSTTDSQAYDVTTFFPPADHGSILITSRLSSLSGIGSPTKIGQMNMAQATEVLSSRSQMSETLKGTETLAERLGHLPLALVQAGAYMQSTKTNPLTYLKLYEQSWLQLLEQAPRLRDYENGSVLTTWQISYERIKQSSPLSAELLQLWILLDYRDIWYDLFSPAKEKLDGSTLVAKLAESQLSFNSILEPLLRYSLVESSRVDGSYALHPVVHDWTGQVIKASYSHFLILAMPITGSMIRSADSQPSFVECSRLLPHIRRLVAHLDSLGSELTIDDDFVDFVDFVIAIGDFLSLHDIMHEAEKVNEWMLKTSKLTVGVNPVMQIEMMCKLADHYRMQGESTKSAELETTLLSHPEYREKLKSNFAPLKLCSLLGTLYKTQNKIAEAESMYKLIINTSKAADVSGRIYRKILLETYKKLGELYLDEGRIDEAEHHYSGALAEIEMDHDSVDYSARVKIEIRLAEVYRRQGRLHDAEALCRRQLKEAENANVNQLIHRTTQVLMTLAVICFTQARYTEAEKHQKEVVDRHESFLGLSHPLTLESKYQLGCVYWANGNSPMAERFIQMVLDGYQETKTPGDSLLLDAVTGLGRIYRRQKRFSEAEELYRRALEGCQEVGDYEKDVCNVMLNLCAMYVGRNNLFQARSMCHQLYQRFGGILRTEELFGRDLSSDDLEDFRFLEAFAGVCEVLGKTAEASNFGRRAEAARVTKQREGALLESDQHADELESDDQSSEGDYTARSQAIVWGTML